MKHTLIYLALLTILTAPVLSSCRKLDTDKPVADKFASVQIAPPSSVDTKVTYTDGTRLSITGWALGDKVTMIKIVNTSTFITSEFICTDVASGTFRGPLPEGMAEVDEFTIAVHNGANFKIIGGEVTYTSGKRISTDLKDMIVMFSHKDGNGKYAMNVVNNIMQITNNTGASISASLKANSAAMYVYIVPAFSCDDTKYSPGKSNMGSFANASFDIPTGISYVSLPSSEGDYAGHKFGIGRSSDSVDKASIAACKSIPTIGTIFRLTVQ